MIVPGVSAGQLVDAEYYDGVTPVPARGSLRLGPSGLFFEPSHGSALETTAVGFPDIIDVSLLNGQTRVTIKGKSPESINGLITFFDTAAHARLKSLVSGSGTGALSRVSLFMKHGPAGKKIALALMVLPVIALVLYGALFESYRLVPRSVDVRLGRLITGRITEEYKPLRNRKLEAVLERIKKRVAPKGSDRTYTILLLDHDIPNAFALPDGHIIILTGLIEASSSPEEIAGIMAHEISHVERRHGIRQLIRVLGMSYVLHMIIGAGFEELETAETISELSGLLLFLKYSRQFEREADEDGVRYLHQAKISCRGLIDLFHRLSSMPEMPSAAEWFSTHPDMTERIAYLSAKAGTETFRARSILRRGEKWSRIKIF